MNEHDNIDNFLKGKLKNRSFAFQDNYWQAAEKLIEADRRSRRRRKGWLLVLLLLLTSFGGAAFWAQYLTPAADGQNMLIAGQNQAGSATKAPDLSPVQEPWVVEIVVEKCGELTEIQGQEINPDDPAPATMKAPFQPALQDRGVSDEARFSLPLPIPGKTPPGRPFLTQNGKVVAFNGKLPPDEYRLEVSLFDLDVSYGNLASSFRKPHSLGITLGTTLSVGLKNNAAKRAAISSHPTLGLRYAYTLNRTLRLQTGIIYQGREGLNADSTYQSVEFGFGAETQATTISPQSLHYLELPLLADLRLAARHHIMGGINLTYLINTRSKVHREEVLPFETIDLGTTIVWGYRQGFSPLDASLMVGYGYYLKKGFRLGVRANYGLRDITDNHFFLNRTKDRNLQIRLVLGYDLFHF